MTPLPLGAQLLCTRHQAPGGIGEAVFSSLPALMNWDLAPPKPTPLPRGTLSPLSPVGELALSTCTSDVRRV